MTCAEFIDILKQENLDDAEIFCIDCDYDQKTGYINCCRNYKILPYPEFTDVFDKKYPAEEYDMISVDFNIKTGKIISREDKHYNTSNKETYNY